MSVGWPTVGWLAVALGVPAIVGAALKDFAQQHPWWSVGLVGAYWVALTVLRFVSGVAADIATRHQPQLVEQVDAALTTRLSRFERAYRRWLLHYLRRMDLQGLATAPHAAPAFDETYIDLSLVPRAHHQISAHPLTDLLPSSNAERLSISSLLAVSEPQVLAVLGAPGSGKTTLLRQAARETCRRRFGRRRVAILLLLREHAETIAADPGVRLGDQAVPASLDRRPPVGWFTSMLERGRCVVLLDGLDEVARDSEREAVVRWVDRQIAAYPRNHFVLTSRRHGYEAAAINSATVLQVRQLTTVQIEKFVDSWYLAVEPERPAAAQQALRLRAQLTGHVMLGDMAVNPLLLTMIVNVHRERGVLPDNRVQLYREICDVLLWRRYNAKGLTPVIAAPDKLRLLAALAYAMMLGEVRELSEAAVLTEIEPPLARLGSAVEPRRVLRELVNDGLLVEIAVGSIAFCHKTFQEYLAAVEIAVRGEAGRLAAAVDSAWWRETIVLYTAEHNADEVIEACLAAQTIDALDLAFDCVEQGTSMDTSLRARMNALVEEIADTAIESERRQLLTRVVVKRFLRTALPVAGNRRCTPPVPASLYRLFLNEEHDREVIRTPELPMPSEPDAPVRGMRHDAAERFAEWIGALSDGARVRLPTGPEMTELAAQGLLGEKPPPVWVAAPDEANAHGERLRPWPIWTPEGVSDENEFPAEDAASMLIRDVDIALGCVLGYVAWWGPVRGPFSRSLAARAVLSAYFDAGRGAELLPGWRFTVPVGRLGDQMILRLAAEFGRTLTLRQDFETMFLPVSENGVPDPGTVWPTDTDYDSEWALEKLMEFEPDGAPAEVADELTAAWRTLGSQYLEGQEGVLALGWSTPLEPIGRPKWRALLPGLGRGPRGPFVHADLQRLSREVDLIREILQHDESGLRALADVLATATRTVLAGEWRLTPALGTLLRLTALAIAVHPSGWVPTAMVSGDTRRLLTACRTLVTDLIIMQLRHEPSAPGEVLVLTRE
ncbi:NACHT domain-containing protein [Nocardia sp. GCM10030253]|uniref:NACHT domain-containing protein n=1 Tax=Nocardia sp. GCM10030253 TaxID=3273404 RepID=UPI00363AD49B